MAGFTAGVVLTTVILGLIIQHRQDLHNQEVYRQIQEDTALRVGNMCANGFSEAYVLLNGEFSVSCK